MTEEIIFKRRNRLRKHFVNTSNVLLYGYRALSGEAKITFQVIESFDWEDKETGDSKGYVFPAIATLADIRGTSERTIYRHIKDLEVVGLLTRQRRSHKASYIFIEDVSQEEADLYMARYVDKATRETIKKTSTDKYGKRPMPSQLTKMSVDNSKEKEAKKENEINVSEKSQQKTREGETGKRYGLEGMSDIMKRFDIVSPRTVSLDGKKESSDAEKEGKLKKVLGGKINTEKQQKREYLAAELAFKFNDEKSLGCYRVIASKVPEDIIFQKMAEVKDSWKEGSIKKSQAAVFVGLIKQYCEKKHIELGFKYTTLL